MIRIGARPSLVNLLQDAFGLPDCVRNSAFYSPRLTFGIVEFARRQDRCRKDGIGRAFPFLCRHFGVVARAAAVGGVLAGIAKDERS